MHNCTDFTDLLSCLEEFESRAGRISIGLFEVEALGIGDQAFEGRFLSISAVVV